MILRFLNIKINVANPHKQSYQPTLLSMMCLLPDEIINIIVNYYNIKQRINVLVDDYVSNISDISNISNLRFVCSKFKKAFNFMIQKILRLDYMMYLLKKHRSFSSELSLCTNSIDYYNYYNNITKYCVNNDCCYQNAKIIGYKGLIVLKRKNYMAGILRFYYPKELELPHDDDNDPYGTNFEYMFRRRQCLDGPKIKRLIPYCLDCMHKFGYIERRSDGQLTPYGDGDCDEMW